MLVIGAEKAKGSLNEQVERAQNHTITTALAIDILGKTRGEHPLDSPSLFMLKKAAFLDPSSG